MNIAVISQNEELKHQLENDNQFEGVLHHRDLKEEMHVDVLLITGDTVDHRDLNDVRKLYPKQSIIYKMEDVQNEASMRNIKMVCEAHNIIPIAENYTSDQVCKEVYKYIFEQNSQSSPRLVGFFGTHSGAGVSTTTLNTAHRLAMKTNAKVLVLSLNPWDPSDYFLQYRGKYLNDLKVALKTNNFSDETLLDAVYQYEDSFYHLAGNRDIKMQRYYNTDEIAKLIEVAKNCFDIILIDAGTHFDNACYAQSYVNSDLKFLVTTQDEKGYRGYFPYILQQLIEPIGGSPDEFMLIANRFTNDISLVNQKDIQEELEMTLLTTIPDQEVLGNVAIAQKNMLYEVAESHYKQSIETIVDSIISRADLEVKEEEKEEEKKGFFGLFSKKKAI
ncbi:Flp pilus assembly CpaE family ATPase [Evansella vedderi]|uniref:Flp pilus assembly CpaE family ATPase n=1 Tax=Evansella vedderi TaxID=38282 RepID=A0ABT9ZX93_9BACI|nr:ParA family protein [Evansella vedderi]MDQ0255489.1 Flp pilus assembly CpaE family ATPase [Evansella vedderi]